MAKLTGPLFSLTASGSLASTLVYNSWRGQARVRELVIPHNPQTVDQTTVRGQFTMAVTRWQGFDAATKLLWDNAVIAAGLLMSGFNYHQGKYITYIRDETGDPPDDPADF
jgi:hypothetical protein